MTQGKYTKSDSQKRKISDSLKGRHVSSKTEYKKGVFYGGGFKKGENGTHLIKSNPTLRALHKWVQKRKPKPTWCEECWIRKPYDLANISQTYKRDINDYKWLCRHCHRTQHIALKRAKEVIK